MRGRNGPVSTGVLSARYLIAIARVLTHTLIVAAAVLLLSFVLMRIAPGDPVLNLLNSNSTDYDDATVERMREELGLGGSLAEQLWRYVGGLLHGDMGNSFVNGAPVSGLILDAFPVTLWLMLGTGVLTVAISVPLALAGTLYPSGWLNRAMVTSFSLLVSTPSFLLGVLAILVFSLTLGVAPSGGYRGEFPEAVSYLWLPTIVITLGIVPVLTRVLLASMTENSREEFVEAAVVRGTGRFRFYWDYLLRPAIAPSVALLSYVVGSMFASSVVVELVFNIHGVGAVLVSAVYARDYPVVQGVTLVSGIVVVLVAAVGQLAAIAVDPRLAR